MGLRINTNVPALVGQRHLRMTRSNLDRTLERLTSGQRINHASDDAAGLANSEILRAQNRGLAQAERNAQDGISVIQIAEGGIAEISNLLIRMRELAVQAASDTIGQSERKFLDDEYQQLLSESDRIANSTEFNHVSLLNGSASEYEVQIGTRNYPTIDRIQLFNGIHTDVTVAALGVNLSSVDSKISAQTALGTLDSALQVVSSVRAQFGATQNRLQSIITNIMVSRENLSSATSRIRDADIAEETSELTKNQILFQSGISVLTQANTTMKSALNLLSNGG